MIVICDRHHGGLYLSLIYLFQKRLGYDLRFPYGMEWAEKGYFDYFNKDFITGTLTCQPDALAQQQDPDKIFGYGSGGMGKPITLEEACDSGKQIIFLVSSLHESEQTFARFIADHVPQAVLLRQCGNPNERVRFTRHALCSDLETYNRVKKTHHAVLYHQEFNRQVFRFRRVNLKGRRKIRSFLNYLADMKYLRRYWDRLRREFADEKVDFYLHGLKGADTAAEGWHGAPADIREMAEWMADMHMLCQLKNWDGFGHCYAEDTQILSERGWKPFWQLRPDERVATLDSQHQLIYQAPTAYHAYAYKGKMISLKGRSIDILVTPKHRIYCQEYDHFAGPLGWKVFEADNKRLRRQKRYYPHTSLGFLMAPERIVAGSPVNTDWAEFIGWYVSEGCLARDKKGDKYRKVIISNTNRGNLKRIARLARRLGHHAGKCHHGIRISSVRLASRLEPLGKSINKKIPREILDGDAFALSAFLRGYLGGDGHNNSKSKGNWRAKTISPDIADGVQEAAIKLGWRATIRRKKAKTSSGNVVYEVIIGMSRNIKKLYAPAAEVDYDGTVWCVTVPNGIILVRRNGSPVFCGNCVHYSYAIGRPMICRWGDYEAKLGGLLIEDMKTGVKLSGVWEDDKKKIMRVLGSDGYVAQMCWNCVQKFNTVVNFDEEEKEIRQWINEI